MRAIYLLSYQNAQFEDVSNMTYLNEAAIGFKEKITTQIFEKLYDIVLYERTTDFN